MKFANRYESIRLIRNIGIILIHKDNIKKANCEQFALYLINIKIPLHSCNTTQLIYLRIPQQNRIFYITFISKISNHKRHIAGEFQLLNSEFEKRISRFVQPMKTYQDAILTSLKLRLLRMPIPSKHKIVAR